MFAFLEQHGPVGVAFTDRAGGVSAAPYDELNLASHGQDDPAAVSENLRRALKSFCGDPEAPVAAMHQVHGTCVDTVSTGAVDVLDCAGHPEADGLVTTTPGLVLMVRVADCVPVLLTSDDGPGSSTVVAAVHSGRAGLRGDVVGAAVQVMRGLGAETLKAWVGPHICGRCYEVPEAMRSDVAGVVPEAACTTSGGTPGIDLGAGVDAQLVRAGLRPEAIHRVSRCTREHLDLYSHRREGRSSGRLAGLVRIAP